MDSEKIMKLFHTCWFEMEILKKQSRLSSSSNFEATPDHQNEEEPSKPEILRIPTGHKRSMSAQFNSETSFNSLSLSPDSVLAPPKLQRILSEKEITDEVEETKQAQVHVEENVSKKKVVATITRRRTKNKESKSLSDLEFEELKGFMDLGFVFTEEDNKDSRLVEIVPGLQRLGRKDDTLIENSDVPRPYLSEAWEIMDSRRKGNSELMNWKIPPLNNEMDMKDSLRWWAHTVALCAVI